MLENESAEACFLNRQQELRPLLRNVTTEQFAHAEQVIQAALAQAVALNAGHEINDFRRDHHIICADEEIVVDQIDDCEVLEEALIMPDDIYMNTV